MRAGAEHPAPNVDHWTAEQPVGMVESQKQACRSRAPRAVACPAKGLEAPGHGELGTGRKGELRRFARRRQAAVHSKSNWLL